MSPRCPLTFKAANNSGAGVNPALKQQFSFFLTLKNKLCLDGGNSLCLFLNPHVFSFFEGDKVRFRQSGVSYKASYKVQGEYKSKVQVQDTK